ncbi:MAG TPA: 6-pyruvoyl-tetrahydropterin synthase-related protein [Steroidobacteraceae bacterium]|nr:6-pyruvoyl-tetrahydropterin synthase-related protein [Steroidobacteraceae bacterium]
MSYKRINDACYWSACALLLGVVVFGMTRPLLAIGRYIPLDPNEGWNAYFGDAAINGGVLYPAADALITNNYPPLSFYVVGAIGHLTGDNIFAGRVIALLSLLFVTWSIYYWLRVTGSARRIGLLAAGIFLAYAVTYGRDYVAMDDPQWLAHALMMAGLLVLWKGKDDTRHIVLGAILMMAAGWTKHLLIPLPVTVSLWLLWRSRPAFAKWVLSATITLAVAAALAWWLHGMRLFESLDEPRQYMRWKAIGQAMAALRCFTPLVVLWLAALVNERLNERLGFLSTYLLISGGIGLFAAGGAGVDVNSFFDPLIAFCLVAGVAVESLWTPRLSWGAPAALATAICVVGYTVTLAPLQLQEIRSIDADEQAALLDIQVIRADSHGHAACEMLNLCYWAKSDFMMDFFYFGQKLKTGVLPRTACADAFEHGNISLVQLESNPRFRAKLLPNDCDALITSTYHSVHQSSFGPLLMRTGITASRN